MLRTAPPEQGVTLVALLTLALNQSERLARSSIGQYLASS
jgi:hypothetical protein